MGYSDYDASFWTALHHSLRGLSPIAAPLDSTYAGLGSRLRLEDSPTRSTVSIHWGPRMCMVKLDTKGGTNLGSHSRLSFFRVCPSPAQGFEGLVTNG